MSVSGNRATYKGRASIYDITNGSLLSDAAATFEVDALLDPNFRPDTELVSRHAEWVTLMFLKSLRPPEMWDADGVDIAAPPAPDYLWLAERVHSDRRQQARLACAGGEDALQAQGLRPARTSSQRAQRQGRQRSHSEPDAHPQACQRADLGEVDAAHQVRCG